MSLFWFILGKHEKLTSTAKGRKKTENLRKMKDLNKDFTGDYANVNLQFHYC